MYQSNFPVVPFRLGLYPIVDSVVWIERLLNIKVRTIQLRIKNKYNRNIESEIVDAIAVSKSYQARLFINDYWQLAIKHQAYGVHLGQNDIRNADLQAISTAGLHLGISAYDDMEIKTALSVRPSYISLGHVFTTYTKKTFLQPQGLKKLSKYVTSLANCPTVAIGGINIERVLPVLATGVGGIAIASAITMAHNWQLTTLALLQLIESNIQK